jgi:hypothetical protein
MSLVVTDFRKTKQKKHLKNIDDYGSLKIKVALAHPAAS